MKYTSFPLFASAILPAVLLLACGGELPERDQATGRDDTNDSIVTIHQTNVENQAGWDLLNDQQRRSIEHLQNTQTYLPDMLVNATADVEIEVYNETTDEITLAAWKDKWLPKVVSFKLTGGCGCCVDIYTVTGPKAAIEEFPISEYRRQYYPKYHKQQTD